MINRVPNELHEVGAHVDVTAAARRIGGFIRRTPVLTSDSLDAMLGATLFFKAEHRQLTGSFKFRGVLNTLLQRSTEELACGVIAASSGNHGIALASAAKSFKTTATIVLPDDAPRSKRAAIESLGAAIVPFDRATTERSSVISELVSQRGGIVLPSSDDCDVIAGNGSAAIELISSVPDLDSIIAPVGGGGMAAGSALAARALAPTMSVYGAEPALADDTIRSLRAGAPVGIAPPTTIADGLRHCRPGTVTFPILQRTVEDILPVSEEQITTAMRLLYNAFGDALEPSGACAFAAVLGHPDHFAGRRIGIMLTGANIEFELFCALTGTLS